MLKKIISIVEKKIYLLILQKKYISKTKNHYNDLLSQKKIISKGKDLYLNLHRKICLISARICWKLPKLSKLPLRKWIDRHMPKYLISTRFIPRKN